MRRSIWMRLLPAALLWLFSSLGLAAQEMPAYLSLQNRVTEIFRENEQAVVRVFTVFTTPEIGDDSTPQEGEDAEKAATPEPPATAAEAREAARKPETFLYVGTGYLISKEGHVLTNANIAHGADRIWVNYNGVEYLAEHLGSDDRTNVSLLKVPGLPENTPFLRLPDRDAPPAVGSFVLAISCELGMEPAPSFGIIKGEDVNYGETVLPTVYLRAEIPSDGGEGGSPVFDLSGRLVGMMVASLPDIRSSYILPARAVKKIRDDILFSGAVEYALFGLSTEVVNSPEMGQRLRIAEVFDDTPAKEAGLRVGDILVKIGDYTIERNQDMKYATFFARPGEVLAIEILREGEPVELSLKAGKLEPLNASRMLELRPNDTGVTTTNNRTEP